MRTDLTYTQRAADLAARFMGGQRLSVGDIAEDYNMSHSGAYRLVVRISVVVPIVPNGDSVWRSIWSLDDANET